MNKLKLTLTALAVFSTISFAEEQPIEIQSNIIGDKEQPLVSYFIPWQEIGTPDKLQWNIDSKFDKTLDLVDRKVLLRSSNMYEHMKLENKAPKTNEAP
ncbi:hypothetical protein FLL45_03025 [Aliikangiella marina]|uniref:Uncharacterized protein n=1 Tax=Aliikangiella marina TaxID=1712262 RepID=A0A545TI91_9GAMM|nr:hypothetical protein [Aliikangiella marina]TQV76940.1 hypothetical protein FLL45_03025 [Aliikangiella marina]